MPAVSKWLKINEFALSFPEFIFSEQILDCFCSHAIFDDKKSSELKNSENKWSQYTGHSESITTFVLAQIISIEKIARIIDISEQPKKTQSKKLGYFMIL